MNTFCISLSRRTLWETHGRETPTSRATFHDSTSTPAYLESVPGIKPRYIPILSEHIFPPAPPSTSSPTTYDLRLTTHTTKPTEASHQHQRMDSPSKFLYHSLPRLRGGYDTRSHLLHLYLWLEESPPMITTSARLRSSTARTKTWPWTIRILSSPIVRRPDIAPLIVWHGCF
jgi:hypothetical protein